MTRQTTVSIPENIKKDADAAAALVTKKYMEFQTTFEQRQRDAHEAVINSYRANFNKVKPEASVTPVKIAELRAKAIEANPSEKRDASGRLIAQPTIETRKYMAKPEVKPAKFFTSIKKSEKDVAERLAKMHKWEVKKAQDATVRANLAKQEHVAFAAKHNEHSKSILTVFGRRSEEARKAAQEIAKRADEFKTTVHIDPSFKITP